MSGSLTLEMRQRITMRSPLPLASLAPEYTARKLWCDVDGGEIV